MLKKFVSLTLEDQDLNRVQSNVEKALTPVLTNLLLDSNLVREVPLVVGTNVVDHKLGRAPIGYIITRQRAAANIYDVQDTNSTPSKNFLINSDAVTNVDVYFF